jgi:hypothetical protein
MTDMNRSHRETIPPSAGSPTPPAEPPAPFWRTDDTAVDRLKNRLLRAELEAATGAALVVALRRAANEAASIAWLEPFPLLVLPGLFAEKAAAAHRSLSPQSGDRTRSTHAMEEAA